MEADREKLLKRVIDAENERDMAVQAVRTADRMITNYKEKVIWSRLLVEVTTIRCDTWVVASTSSHVALVAGVLAVDVRGSLIVDM